MGGCSGLTGCGVSDELPARRKSTAHRTATVIIAAAMSEITQLLNHATDGGKSALDDVFNQLHAELKILARSRIRQIPDQTLTATALVHELYLKLVGAEQLDLVSRQHFFACAGMAMRQILVDAARAGAAQKRGGDVVFVTLDDAGEQNADTEILALDQALDELQAIEPALAELVQLRYFAGLPLGEIAALKDRSSRSLQRDWAAARAFLNARMTA